MTWRLASSTAIAMLALWPAACGSDGGGSRGPVAGESVELESVRGQVLIKQPGEETFATLEGETEVQIGTQINASNGTVRMISATASGGTQSGEFAQGGFQVEQKAGSSEVTLELRGGDFSECKTKAARRDRSTVGGPEIRRLFVEAEGRFRTEGRFATTSIRGTSFTVVDACFGTLTDVEEGKVQVTDLIADREIDLSAGQEYWAAQRP